MSLESQACPQLAVKSAEGSATLICPSIGLVSSVFLLCGSSADMIIVSIHGITVQPCCADVAKEMIKRHSLDDTFYVFDLGLVARLHAAWCSHLPSVRPFYAVKCNPDRAMLALLASLGSGFDCASAAEIDLVMSLGVSPDRIIYAHPCKPLSHIRHAAAVSAVLTMRCTALA